MRCNGLILYDSLFILLLLFLLWFSINALMLRFICWLGLRMTLFADETDSRVYFQAWAEGELIGQTGKAMGKGATRVWDGGWGGEFGRWFLHLACTWYRNRDLSWIGIASNMYWFQENNLPWISIYGSSTERLRSITRQYTAILIFP